MELDEAIGLLIFLKTKMEGEPEMKPIVEALKIAIDKLLTSIITERILKESEEYDGA